MTIWSTLVLVPPVLPFLQQLPRPSSERHLQKDVIAPTQQVFRRRLHLLAANLWRLWDLVGGTFNITCNFSSIVQRNRFAEQSIDLDLQEPQAAQTASSRNKPTVQNLAAHRHIL
ncbi:hypothetical protein BJ742DRAFT_811988 [Cladochytrium replicatum]|nr:hypothetical protein BJ742DRAFT_811988 [Cladochytrium replicatum]